MKIKYFYCMLAAVLLTASLCSCGKEDPKPDPAQGGTSSKAYVSIENTSWEGEYLTSFQSPYGQQQMLLQWIVDFNEEQQGYVVVNLKTPVSDDYTEEYPMSYYSYKGDNTGYFVYMEDTVSMTFDPINRTMTCTLLQGVQTTEDGDAGYYGGLTTLYQTRK